MELIAAQKRRSAPSSKPLPKRKIFPFLQLPAEIRNIIYENCLSDPAGIYLEATTKKYRRTVQRCPEDRFRYFPAMPDSDDGASDSGDEEKGPRKESRPGMRRLVPSLLAVCKQINQEGRDILYGNHFYLADTLAMHSFLVDLTPRGASLLKQITLICWGQGRGIHKAYNHAGFAALASATNLEKFKVHGYRGWSADSKSVARTFYRDAFPWLEAVGAAKGKLDAAVDIIEVRVSLGNPLGRLLADRAQTGMLSCESPLRWLSLMYIFRWHATASQDSQSGG